MSKFAGSWSITEELFNLIRDILPAGKTILELGSGEGTAKLLEHYNVYSIEHSRRWLNKIEGGNYIHAPIKQYTYRGDNGVDKGYRWYDVDKLKDLPEYDLLLVDGPPGTVGRMGVVHNGYLFDMTVPIIIDDTHRDEERRIAIDLTFYYDKMSRTHGSTKKKFTILT